MPAVAHDPSHESANEPREIDAFVFPASFAQSRLWFLSQLDPASPVYNVPAIFRVDGPLDHRILEGAVNEIIARHESLRTTFRVVDDRPAQVILPEMRVRVNVVSLSALPRDEREGALAQWLVRETSTPFDLAKGPLLRVTLVELGEREHVLVFGFHHIVTDMWSQENFMRELTTLYRAFHAHEPSPLPALWIQYADYSSWQREMLANAATASHLAFWREQLRDLPSPLPIPADRPRPARQSLRGALRARELSAGLSAGLREVARSEGVTLFVLTLAACKALLARYSGETDICIGSPVAQRPSEETEELIGYFLNTLALRSNLSGDPDFRELLRRVRSTVLDAFQHQDVPFEKIVEEVQPGRDASRHPIFQIAFVLLPEGNTTPSFPGTTVVPVPIPVTTAKFDLTICIEEAPGGMRATIEYATDLFEAATVDQMLESLQLMLEGIVADPSTPLSRLPILGAAQRSRILTEWSGSERPYPAHQTIAARFAECVARTPEAIAMIDDGTRLTYRELDALSNRVARHLQSHGIREGDFVGLRAERSPAFVVKVLGIAKAGAAYVPLDAEEPAARLEPMKAACALILDSEPDASVPADPVAPAGRPDGPAYVLFTSGSTGTPKGVIIPHRGITRLVINNDYAPVGKDDVVAFASNVCFDAATFEIWGALLNGATLTVLPREVLLSTSALAAFITTHGVTTLFLTTALFNQIARHVPAAFRPLTHLLFGGEACNAACVRRVLQEGAPRRLVHVYGPTETTTFATWHLVREVASDAATVPIGRPIANTTVHILDSHMQPVPIGVTGEIHIGGPGVASGYLGEPALTAARFPDTPFGRLYKSGDLACHHADGAIEFRSRADSQVKLRGFRIEPGEIEAALQQHPAVLQCAILANKHGNDESVLIGCLVPRSNQRAEGAAIREFLASRLPAYMIPSAFVWFDALPLTPNGKLDRRVIAERTTQVTQTRAYVPPQFSLQAQLIEIWEEVLNRRPIGISDDFFELGGHSLAAIQLISRIRETFQTDLPIRRLFSTPTVAGVAEYITAQTTPAPATRQFQSLLAIQKGNPDQRPFFLVPGGWGAELEFLVYGVLARHVGADQPFYGLKARGSDGVATPHHTLAQMVADYVAEIRTVQPHGPYLIGGECVGGVAAYEIARVLEAMGEKVALLALLGTEPPSRAALRRLHRWDRAKNRKDFWQARIVQPFKAHMQQLAKLPLGGKIRYLWTRLNRKRFWNAKTAGEQTAPLESHKLLAQYPRMLMGHKLGAYTGRITLLIDETSHGKTPNLGWENVHRGELEVHVLPGTHLSYIRENAAITAAKLRELLILATSNLHHAPATA